MTLDTLKTTNRMESSDNLRYTKLPLNNGSGAIPALGFGTLIPDPVATKNATKAALEAGFRALDTAERYGTEKEVGEAMKEVFKAGKIKREDVFVATKLWNTNHRPERVKPAFEASLKKLQLDYLDLYLIHTPFAFQPGDVQDPRDANGNVIYDRGVTLLDTWRALEELVHEGKCKAIGLSDVRLEKVKEIFEAATHQAGGCSRRVPSVSPGVGTVGLLPKERNRAAGFRCAGSQQRAQLAGGSCHHRYRQPGRQNSGPGRARVGDPARDRAPDHLKDSCRIKENFDVSTLPEDAMREINEGIKSRMRFNPSWKPAFPGSSPEASESNSYECKTKR